MHHAHRGLLIADPDFRRCDRGIIRAFLDPKPRPAHRSGSKQSLGCTMPGNDWVSVGAYSNLESAEVVSGRLSVEGVENQVVSAEPAAPLYGAMGEWSIVVPPERLEAARRILTELPISEAELTSLALKDPPPDDFDSSASTREDQDP